MEIKRAHRHTGSQSLSQFTRAAAGDAAVKAPGFGDRRKALLEDIAVITGGKAITEELGIKLET